MRKEIILLLIFLFMFPFINAEESGMVIRIVNNTIDIHGYVITSIAGKVKAGFFESINETISSNPILCNYINITEGNNSKVYQQNCSLNINFLREVSFKVENVTSTIIGDAELQRKYETCLDDKYGFRAGLESCSRALYEQGQYESNFTICSTDLKICRSEKSVVDGEKGKCETEMKENENRHWIWGIGGLIIGAVFILYREGRIFNPKVRKEEDSYNPQQSA